MIAGTDSTSLLDADDLFDFNFESAPSADELIVDAKIVCPFTICVDSREQAPYHFVNIDPFSIIPLKTDAALATGDYSIAGFESLITIERKSISDFLGSITSGRERFEREFERMSKMEFAAVVVEGELSEVLREATAKTKIRIDSILGTVNAWTMRYRVHFWFCMGRRFAEIQTLKILYQFWRERQRAAKGNS